MVFYSSILAAAIVCLGAGVHALPGPTPTLNKRADQAQGALYTPPPAASRGQNVYSKAGVTASIKWSGSPQFQDGPPSLPITVTFTDSAGKTHTTAVGVNVDTGSTGLLLGAGSVPGGIDAIKGMKGEPGYQLYSSNNLLSLGKWVKLDMQIKAAGQDGIISMTPSALLVTYQATCTPKCSGCPGFKPSDFTPTLTKCPEQFGSKDAHSLTEPTHTAPHYMGIGFGAKHPSFNSATNALRNVVSINGKAVSKNKAATGKSLFWEGYVLTKDGITLGLNSDNKCKWTKLESNNDAVSGDWKRIPGCVSINGGPCEQGRLLLDTGINSMFLTIPTPAHAVKQTPAPYPKVFTNGDSLKVVMGAGDAAHVAGSYSFTMGSDAAQAVASPASKIYPWTVGEAGKDESFVNTGVRIFNYADVCFDSINGYYGMRAHVVAN